MSRQQDILFCKIAIQSGLVSQDNAQKCLALADRREKESNRRPMIGALFTKHNLLTTADVQRLNGAVAKRLGGDVVAPPAPPRSGGRGSDQRNGGGRARGPGGRGGRAPRPRRATKIDQRTLFMGLGTGAVFVAVIVTIIILFVRGGGKKPGATESAAAAGMSNSNTSSSSTTPEDAGASDPSVDEARAEAERIQAAREQVDAGFAREHSAELKRINYVFRIDGNAELAETGLANFLEKNKLNYEAGGQSLLAEATALLEEIRGGEPVSEDDDDLDLEE